MMGDKILMDKTPNIPTWQALEEELREQKLTGKITLNCVNGSVVEYEVMRRYKAERPPEETDENG